MRVLCIESDLNGPPSLSVVKGNLYDARTDLGGDDDPLKHLSETHYCILFNSSTSAYFKKDMFLKLEDIRNSKLEELGI